MGLELVLFGAGQVVLKHLLGGSGALSGRAGQALFHVRPDGFDPGPSQQCVMKPHGWKQKQTG